jgi:NAD(P)H-dependent FMN reductase
LLRVLSISGSLRAASTNTALLAALARNAPDAISLTHYDGLGLLPIFNPDDEDARTPDEVSRLIDAARAADGVIVSSPEYAHGVPGGLKNALDWLVSRDAAVGKPAMLVHASPRSAISRAALAEIMRTMSFELHPGPELEIALIGKKPHEVDAILSAPDNVAAMRNALTRLAAFIGDRRAGG